MENGLAAVILAASGRRVSGYSDDPLVCHTEFAGRTVLEWLTDWLDAWAVTDQLVVAAQADRSHHLGPACQPNEFEDDDAEHHFQLAVEDAMRGRREVSDPDASPVPPVSGLRDLGRYLFVGPEAAGDPLNQLVAAMPLIDNDLVLVIDADTLPPPINPYDLTPTVADAACLALGPTRPGWQHGYTIDRAPAAGQVSVNRVISDPTSVSRTALVTEALGVAGARRLSILAATDGPTPARSWAELHTRWAKAGALSGRFYSTTPPPFTTAVELAIARADFASWHTAPAHHGPTYPEEGRS